MVQHQGCVANCAFFFFLIPNQNCFTGKNEKRSLWDISDQQNSSLQLLFCCYYFNNIPIGVSSFWRVFPGSCLLHVQDTNLETNSLILPCSPTGTLITGSLSPSPPSRHNFQWWPRMSQLGEELAEERSATPVKIPSAQGGSGLWLTH